MSEELLNKIDKKLEILTIKLYGENGFEGDITEIKRAQKASHDNYHDLSERMIVTEQQVAGLEKFKDRTVSILLKVVVPVAGGGGIIAALVEGLR